MEGATATLRGLAGEVRDGTRTVATLSRWRLEAITNERYDVAGELGKPILAGRYTLWLALGTLQAICPVEWNDGRFQGRGPVTFTNHT